MVKRLFQVLPVALLALSVPVGTQAQSGKVGIDLTFETPVTEVGK